MSLPKSRFHGRDILAIVLNEHGVVINVPGVVWSPGSKIVSRSGDGDWLEPGEVIVIKEPGRHYPSGTGQPWGYAPAEYVGYSVLTGGTPTSSGGRMIQAQRIFSFPVRGS